MEYYKPMVNISNNIPFVNTELPDILELRNVSHTYDQGNTFVIKDLNFLIEDKPNQGQFVVILGTSGCGKSTLLRYICGLQTPTSGEVLIRGKPRDDSTAIGMVFQRYSSFPWLSVLKNVSLGLHFQGIKKKEAEEKAMEMIRLVGLDGHQHKFAQYPTLSGGQLQRVAIARSLVSDPQILLMDEPFGALDINTRLRMQDLLCEIWLTLQTTIVFVTHDISEAVYLADEIHIMRSNPAKIVDRIGINLTKERNRYMKRTKEFTDIVHYVEDKMVEIELQLFEEQKNSKTVQ